MRKYTRDIVIQSFVWTVALIFWILFRQFGQELVEEPPPKSLLEHFLLYVSLGTMGGIAFVLVENFLTKKLKVIQSFGVAILVSSVLYLVIFVIMIIIGTFLYSLQGEMPVSWSIISGYLLSKEGGLLLFYLFFIFLLIDFVRQVDKKFGPGNLIRMVKGEFYRPKEVERIVMFLDLKSSTTIAEKIGHIKFSQLLQDCFQDLSIVRKYEAEIYQYVGDEAVLVWERQKGLKKMNFLQFYFAYKSKLKKRDKYYMREYGITPKFKCGCHIGKVIMTEIGEIKREIAYHGDVMNTAARIQDQCSKNEKEFLLSEELYHLLPSNIPFNIKILNKILLKGKESEVSIYSVENEN